MASGRGARSHCETEGEAGRLGARREKGRFVGMETGLAVTAVLAALYGVGFAVMPKVIDWPRSGRMYTMGGAALVAAAGILLVIIPWMGDRA